MNMSKILVTGGTGFLGENLALKLHKLGNEVTILGRNKIKGDQLSNQGLKFLPVDITNQQATIDACQNQDYVFHSAALCSPWGKYQDFYQVNVLGTKHIIQGCQTHNIKRLIHVSTSAVYFDFTDQLNIPETANFPTMTVNGYAKTKQLAELEINQANRQGLPTITIRPRGIFGPGDRTILPRLIRTNQATGIPLINGGKAVIDVTYIDNVVDALILCQNAPDTLLGRTFNITNGEPLSLRNLLQTLFAKLDYPCNFKPISYQSAYGLATLMELAAKTIFFGKEPVLTKYTVGLLSKDQTLDIRAAINDLGYRPAVSMEEGLSLFATWWKANC